MPVVARNDVQAFGQHAIAGQDNLLEPVAVGGVLDAEIHLEMLEHRLDKFTAQPVQRLDGRIKRHAQPPHGMIFQRGDIV